MPPLNACQPNSINFVQRQPEPVKTEQEVDEDVEFNQKFSYFHIRRPAEQNRNIRYIYVDQNKYGLVWPNVFMFSVLHIYYFYGLYQLVTQLPVKTWFFGYFYMHAAGLGVTMGAHRLWAHKAYSARLPLRMLLCLMFTISGQNDIITWARDHRVHHKFTETDADPHNSKRGMFFAHVGWLLTRKHPDVLIKGKGVPLDDLKQDSVVMFNRRYYVPLYLFFRFFIPIFVPMYFWNEQFSLAMISMFAQYIGMLHSTWFVNSAAHLFGDRPYNQKIQPRNNFFVNVVAMGEGFHNFHHAFPYDYAIDEHGSKINLGKHLIDFFSRFGLAYKLKRASPELIKTTRQRVMNEKNAKEEDHYLNPHPYC